jgi:uncharacterized OsmC-like protein
MNIKRIKYTLLSLIAGFVLVSASIILNKNEGLKKIEQKLNEKFKEDTPQTYSGTNIEPNPKN